jgi:hypothetical protein
MNSSCKHNLSPLPATRMARVDYFAKRPSVFAWAAVVVEHDLFILNYGQDVRTGWHGCRKRLWLEP